MSFSVDKMFIVPINLVVQHV